MLSSLQDLRFGARLLRRAPAFTARRGRVARDRHRRQRRDLRRDQRPPAEAAPGRRRRTAWWRSSPATSAARPTAAPRTPTPWTSRAARRRSTASPSADVDRVSLTTARQPEQVLRRARQPELLRRPRPRERRRPAAERRAHRRRATPSVVLTHRFWQRRFDGDPGVDRPRRVRRRPRRGDDRRRRGAGYAGLTRGLDLDLFVVEPVDGAARRRAAATAAAPSSAGSRPARRRRRRRRSSRPSPQRLHQAYPAGVDRRPRRGRAASPSPASRRCACRPTPSARSPASCSCWR